MIDLNETHEFAIVEVAEGEGSSHFHVGSSRIWNEFVVLHEIRSGKTECCFGDRVAAIPLALVLRIEVFADEASWQKSIDEDHVLFADDDRKRSMPSPEVR